MENLKVFKRFRALVNLVVTASLVLPNFVLAEPPPPPAPVPAFKAFSAAPANLEQAKITAEAAGAKFLADFNKPTAHAEFAMLIKANEITGFIEAGTGADFLKYVIANFAKLSADNRVAGIPNINWQMFLTQAYLLFQIERTNALNQPNAFMQWLKKVYTNPYVEWATYGTFTVIVGTVAFVKGVAYGAMVAGPGATAVNAVLNPVMTPLNQKLTVIGLKYLGPAGMWLNWLFFERKLERQATQTVEELKKASEAIEGIKSLVEGGHYQMSAQQWAENRSVMMQAWNRLQFIFGLIPDAYRGGRNLHIDMAVLRQRDFANAAATSVTAAEVQRQAVEQIIDRMQASGARLAPLEGAVQVLGELAADQVMLEREAPERAGELMSEVERAKQELLKIGVSAENIERIHEHYRNHHAFRRQAATMLAAQTLNDAMFADTIEGARSLYETMYKNTALNHLHTSMKYEVIEILKKMSFVVKARSANLALEMAARKHISAEQRLTEIKEGTNSARRAVMEPGSLSQPTAETGEQRAREAARGALKK